MKWINGAQDKDKWQVVVTQQWPSSSIKCRQFQIFPFLGRS